MKTFTVYDFKDVLTLIDDKEYKIANEMLVEIYDYNINVLHVESSYVIYYLGVLQYYLGNNFAAIDWFNKSLELDPYNYHHASFRGQVLSEIESTIDSHVPYGIARLKEVEKIYLFLKEQGFVRSALQFSMIRFYLKINDKPTAKVMLQNFLDRNPNDEDAKALLMGIDSFIVDAGALKSKQKTKAA
jgi:tetratricopeptide (TPR) repeat protein